MSMDVIPVWVLFAGSILVVLVAMEGGYRLGAAMHRRSDAEKEAPVSAITGAILGLATFMLAFTFAIVWDRYDIKRALVREDAVAIRTAWHRSDFLPEPDRAEAADLLREYLDLRLTFAQARSLDPERVRAVRSETQRIQDRLWERAVANARRDMNSDVAALYIESLNEVTGINALRVALGVQARVPIEIWFMLYFVTVLGMAGLGYQTGIAGSKRSIVQPVMAVAFATVIALIASLDRPDSGVLKVLQQPLIDLREEM